MTMKEKMIMFSISQLKIMTAKHLLEQAGIAHFSLDKMDSAHAGLFGDIMLYVDEKDADKARELLVDESVMV